MSSIVMSPPTAEASGSATLEPLRPPVVTVAPSLVELVMLDGFELLVDGLAVALTPNSQRLLAFLALNDRPLSRSFVAGSLWLDASDGRAGANLRSALWRLRQASAGVVQVTGDRLVVSGAVRVDVRDAVAHARRVVGDPEVPLVGDLDGAELLGELLPDWYDDWVLAERERLRQLRVHALEHICRRLTALGRVAEAIDVGLAAVAIEPLRESAHHGVITAHLAEGNRSEALRQFDSYRTMLLDQLGIEPSDRLIDLVETTGIAVTRAGAVGTPPGRR